MFKNCFILISFVLLAIISRADSPLTSTPFYKAYSDEKIVKRASEKGLDKKIIKYLSKSKKDPVLKIAAINAVSWGKEGTTKKFEDYLLKKRDGLEPSVFEYLREVPEDQPQENEQTKLLTADDLMCWTYLQALEDYHNPQYCMSGAYFSFIREQKSMAHGVVFMLVACQNAFDYNWCKVYKLSEIYLKETEYESNKLNAEAVAIISDYLNLYRDSCEE